MDTTNQISAYVQRITFSNAQSYLPADRLVDMNIRYRRIITAITSKVQDFFWTWGIADTITTQNEYAIDTFTFDDTFTRDIISVDWVSLKYKTDYDFLKLKKWDFSILDNDFANYTDWAWTPFYFVRDKSVFIAPNPLENVTEWLKIYGNYRPLDLTLSDVNTQIKIPLLYTYVIAEWMCADYWMSQWKYDVASVFEAKFEAWLQKMINSISTRDREITGFITE